MKLFLLLIVILTFNFWSSQSSAQTAVRENQQDHTTDANSLSAEGNNEDCFAINDIDLTSNTNAVASTVTPSAPSGGGSSNQGQGHQN